MTEIEKAVKTVLEFRSGAYNPSWYDEAHIILSKLEQDTRLIECTIQAEELTQALMFDDFSENGEYEIVFLMDEIILREIGVPFGKFSGEQLGVVGRYFLALILLAEYGIDDTSIMGES